MTDCKTSAAECEDRRPKIFGKKSPGDRTKALSAAGQKPAASGCGRTGVFINRKEIAN